MMPFASPYGSPLYWSFHERPEAWHIDPFHQYAKQLVFFGGGRFTHSTHYHDSSLYGSHGTLTNMEASSDWVRELGRWALDFDGSDDQIRLPTIGLSYPFCVAQWIRPKSLAASYRSFSFCAYAAGGVGHFFSLLVATVGAKFGCDVYAGVGTYNYSESTQDGSANNWHSLIGIWRSATNRQVYLNGVPGVVNTASVSPTGTTTTTIGALRRAGYDPQQPFPGQISDTLMWVGRELSASEISPLADPSNVMLSLGGSDPGLIVPDDLVYPVYLPSSVVAGAKPALWLGVCV